MRWPVLVGLEPTPWQRRPSFFGVAVVPDVFVGRMITEFAVLQGLAGGGVKDREGPVGDEV